MEFTVEELHLLCIYDTSSRAALLEEMEDSLPYVDEPEIRELMERVMGKLEDMSSMEFAEMELFSAESMMEEMEV